MCADSELDDITHIVLDARGTSTFRCSGYCMFPLLRQGDWITVTARRIEEITVGDITVFRRDGRLVAHRVVHAGTDDAGPYLITRADRARRDEAPLHAPDVLGVVTGAKRRGHDIDLTAQSLSPWNRPLLGMHIAGAYIAAFILRGMTGILNVVQNSWLYHAIAEPLAVRGEIEVIVRVPLVPHLKNLYRSFTLPDIPVAMLQEAPSWSLALSWNASPAVILTFVQDSEQRNTWWICDAVTRLRYRSMGLEDRLLAVGETCLLRIHATRLRLPISLGTALRRSAQRQGFCELDSDRTILEKVLRKDDGHDQ